WTTTWYRSLPGTGSSPLASAVSATSARASACRWPVVGRSSAGPPTARVGPFVLESATGARRREDGGSIRRQPYPAPHGPPAALPHPAHSREFPAIRPWPARCFPAIASQILQQRRPT